jgi:hypothetical protein
MIGARFCSIPLQMNIGCIRLLYFKCFAFIANVESIPKKQRTKNADHKYQQHD